jgi:ATP-dependent DNA helicase RecQ
MKMELRIEGKVIVIEAEGAVSVQVRDEKSAAVAPSVTPAPAVAPVVAPAVDAPAAVSAVAPIAASGDLFAKLVQLRRELAMAASVPPYVIFNDKSLHEMTEKLPQDLAAFGNISGVGVAKLEKYGEIFVSAIKGAAA